MIKKCTPICKEYSGYISKGNHLIGHIFMLDKLENHLLKHYEKQGFPYDE